jgi:hypothetical protein
MALRGQVSPDNLRRTRMTHGMLAEPQKPRQGSNKSVVGSFLPRLTPSVGLRLRDQGRCQQASQR